MTDRLAEIEARLEAATPGPWARCLGSGNIVCTAVLTHAVKNKHGNHPIIADCLPDYCLRHDTGVDDDHRPNLAFIAHSWEDIDYLLAEAKRLRARGKVLIEIAKDRDQQMCPPGTPDCPPRFVGFGRNCPAVCWDAWYALADEEWQAILEGKEVQP